MSTETITYEQPMNEHVRACLRLEKLFLQAENAMQGESVWDTRSTVAAMIEILNILDRPDLKPKLTKELCRHLANFARLEQTPNVDHKKLSGLLADLENIIDSLQSTSGKMAQQLRDNEFLNSIRQHLLNPGGACGFDIPAYHYWLEQPPEKRIHTLKKWFKHLDTIQTAVQCLLRLIRESNSPQPKVAHEGFFQMTLDPQAPCQLIHVSIPHKLELFPEISAGRHGLCVRFYIPNLDSRPTQTPQNVEFMLTTSIL